MCTYVQWLKIHRGKWTFQVGWWGGGAGEFWSDNVVGISVFQLPFMISCLCLQGYAMFVIICLLKGSCSEWGASPPSSIHYAIPTWPVPLIINHVSWHTSRLLQALILLTQSHQVLLRLLSREAHYFVLQLDWTREKGAAEFLCAFCISICQESWCWVNLCFLLSNILGVRLLWQLPSSH